MTVVAAVLGANRKRDDGGGNENEVHYHEDRLELPHDFRHDRRQNTMAENTAEESGIYDPIGRGPITIASNDDDGEEHERETI